MVHDLAGIPLSELVKGTSLGKNVTDVFVAFLYTGFLPSIHGITIVDTCADDIFVACF